jgi:hypothetical protein
MEGSLFNFCTGALGSNVASTQSPDLGVKRGFGTGERGRIGDLGSVRVPIRGLGRGRTVVPIRRRSRGE